MGFRSVLGARQATKLLLEEYLGSKSEWLNTEFKVAMGEGNLPIRKAVSSLANGQGGEVFLGVDDKRQIIGVGTTPQQLGQALGPRSLPPADWYLVSPLVATDIIAVPVGGSAAAWVYVIEVSPLGVPLFNEEDRNLHLYIRQGESSIKATGFQSIAWYRHLHRGRLLRNLFIELAALHGRLSTPYPETVVGDMAWLPHLEETMRTGLFYSVLSARDILTLLGGVGAGMQGQVGLYDGVFDTRMEVTRILHTPPSPGLFVNGRVPPPDLKPAFERAARKVEVGLRGFKGYLQQERLWTDDLDAFLPGR